MSTASAYAVFALLLCSCGKMTPEVNDEMIGEVIETAAGPGADWKVAKSKAYKTVKYFPEDPNARVMHAVALDQCGLKNNALDEAKKAVQLDKDNFFAQFTLGRLLCENQFYNEAIPPLKEAYRLRPGSEDVLVLLAKSAKICGIYDEAVGYYRALAKSPRFKDRPEAYNQIGVLLVKKNDYKRAYAIFLEALKRDKENPSVILNTAIVCDRYLGKTDLALRLYQRYLETTLKNPALEKRRAEVDSRMQAISSSGEGGQAE